MSDEGGERGKLIGFPKRAGEKASSPIEQARRLMERSGANNYLAGLVKELRLSDLDPLLLERQEDPDRESTGEYALAVLWSCSRDPKSKVWRGKAIRITCGPHGRDISVSFTGATGWIDVRSFFGNSSFLLEQVVNARRSAQSILSFRLEGDEISFTTATTKERWKRL